MKQGAARSIGCIVETVQKWIQRHRSGSKEAANMLPALIEGQVCQTSASSLGLGSIWCSQESTPDTWYGKNECLLQAAGRLTDND